MNTYPKKIGLMPTRNLNTYGIDYYRMMNTLLILGKYPIYFRIFNQPRNADNPTKNWDLPCA